MKSLLARNDRDHCEVRPWSSHCPTESKYIKLHKWRVRYGGLESANIFSDPLPVILSDAFGDPRQTPDLLLLQLDVAVKYGVRELLEERKLVQVNLLCEEPVLEVGGRPVVVITIRIAVGLGRRLGGGLEEGMVLLNVIDRSSNLFHVVGSGKVVVPFGEQPSDGREQFGTTLLREVCSERVDGDVDCPAVCLE